jgi:hypothetical protein
MRLVAIEDLSDRLSLVGRKRRHKDKSFHPLVICGRDHRARIGVSCNNHGTLSPRDGTF